MQLTKIAGVALALLLVTGTAAAMPGAAPAQADEHTDDVTDDTDESDPAADAAERGADRPGSAAERGPPVDLPSQVPDFVGDIHDRIGQFLDGDLAGSLGEHLSELTPGDEEPDQSDGDTETTTPDAAATPTAQADT